MKIRFLLFFVANDKHLAPKVQKNFLRQQEARVFDRRPYRADLLEVYRVCDLYITITIQFDGELRELCVIGGSNKCDMICRKYSIIIIKIRWESLRLNDIQSRTINEICVKGFLLLCVIMHTFK